MSQITTHVLDTRSGSPAVGVPIVLQIFEDGAWVELGSGQTDNDGRISDLIDENSELDTGKYKMKFHIGLYFDEQGISTFYPYAEIVFNVENPEEHYHIPLLLSPFGYTTYRGS